MGETMSEYVPTTEEVRDAYVVGFDPEVTARYRAEFDRWLAALIREAKAEALEKAVDEVEDLIDIYEGTADEMRNLCEWGNSNRYSNYAAGMNMAAGKLRALGLNEGERDV